MKRSRVIGAGSTAETAQWVDAALGVDSIPPLVVAIGLAEGHLLDLIEQRAPGTKVLALEPDPEAARAFLQRSDRTGWRASGRLVYLAGPDYAGADQAWRVFPPALDAYKLLVHPSLTHDRQTVIGALQVFKRIQFGVRANADARRRFAPRYLANVIRNVPAIATGRDIRALADVFRGIPAIIAAAGPSLDAAIDDLHAVNGRALLIAVDTALRPLLHAGLTPHLVVGADPGAANARHFHALPDCPDTWLVSESALDPSATSLFADRTFWFRLARHHPWPWLQEQGIDIGLMEMWGSVLTAAFQVACLAGCDPIVMVGADLAYTNGRPYCRGTTYEFDWARETSGGRTLDEVWTAQTSRNKVMRAPDVRGLETVTTATMQSFRDWMRAAAKRSGRRVINATGAGTLFGDAIEQSSLQTALTESHVIPSLDAIALAPKPPSELQNVARRLRAVREAMKVEGTPSAPIADWAAFLGDGYNPSALGAALEEAADAVDGAQRSPSPLTTIDWSKTSTRGLLTQLPEMLSGFHALLASAEPRHAAPLPNRSVLLADSFDLLLRICRDVQKLNRLPLAMKPWQIGRVPVSATYKWPDATRWPVELFEAMIQRLGLPAEVAKGSTFLTRRVRLRQVAAAPIETHVVPRAHTPYATLLLVLEWLRCASEPEADVARVMTPMVQAIEAMTSAGSARTPQAGAMLVLSVEAATSPHRIDLAVPIASAAFARQATGMLCEPQDASHELLSSRTDLFRVSLVVQPVAPALEQSAPTITRSQAQIAPRVLTDEGTPSAIVTYRSGDGMACALYQKHESVVVQPDGSIRPLHRWPRPIVNELPFGDGGAVAWGDGLAGFPDRVDPGYVMYKHDRDGEIQIQELPVRPTVGRWWQGRLYWNCHPRRVESPTGLVSWAPGDEAPRTELPDLPATLGIHSHKEGLTFEIGGGPLQGGRWQRRFERRGWTWRPGTELLPIQLGPYGVASARDASETWTATAYPEADLVRLEAPDGRSVSMACYYPVGLGWLGDSLLVGTMEAELLLFEHLSSRLQAEAV